MKTALPLAKTALLPLALLVLASLSFAAPAHANGVWSTANADPAAMRSVGFKYGMASAYKANLDRFWSKGLKTLVWLGSYSQTTCSFEYSDAKVRERIQEIKGHPGIYGYLIDDEPHAGVFDGDPKWKCPRTPAQIRARNALVKRLDPGKTTVISENRVQSFKALANTTDVMALDIYPCGWWGCDWKKVPAAAAAAKRAGIRRYWAVTQSFGTDWYHKPTPTELKRLIGQWNATRAEQDFAYTWDCCRTRNAAGTIVDSLRGLRDSPNLWSTWRAENRR
jgi:hypothetical protein